MDCQVTCGKQSLEDKHCAVWTVHRVFPQFCRTVEHMALESRPWNVVLTEKLVLVLVQWNLFCNKKWS